MKRTYPKKHYAEQFPLIETPTAPQKPIRVSFDLAGDDATRFQAAVDSFKELEASSSQVAKMLVKIGLNTLDKRV